MNETSDQMILDPDDLERVARAALTHVAEPGDRRMVELVARESAPEVWATLRASDRDTTWPRRARAIDTADLVRRARLARVRLVIPGDQEWPEALTDLNQSASSAAPLGLWVRGPRSLSGLTCRSVAVVGSRASSPYGDWVAGQISADLACEASPWTVVSGGAYGIDAAAHRGALSSHGATIGVLAGGVDRLYPRGNAELLKRIGDDHLVVSESGLGAAPRKRDFLARNRLIAALAQGTLVVEGGPRSGATNTAHWAHDLSRIVMAVPGPITSAQSVTPHRLIRDEQACLVTCAADVARLLEPLGTQPELELLTEPSWFDSLDPAAQAVREALPSRGALTVSEIVTRSGQSVRTCLQVLARLADQGLVAPTGGATWALARPGDPVDPRER